MSPTSKLTRIIGVYHAEGTLRGELAYLWGKLRGTTSCALCDITHRGLGEKPEFKSCRSRFAAPIETLHLDEQDPVLRRFTQGRTPCVVGLTAQGPCLLLDAAALHRCQRSVERFTQALQEAIASLPDEPPPPGGV